jgi:hypothetical protein
MATIRYHTGGSLATLTNSTGCLNSDSPRGCINSFSPRSRRRVLEAINKINRNRILESILFCTLTYPSVFPTSHVTCKVHLDNFCKALSRDYPSIFILWRLEYQVGGGLRRGAPHYHLMLFQTQKNQMIGDIKLFRKYIAETWFRIVGSHDIRHLRAGTQADFMRSFKGALAYCSKYLAKTEQSEIPTVMDDLPGRFWGIYLRDNMPVDEVIHEIGDDVFFRMRRAFYAIYRKKVGRKYKFAGSLNGLSTYLSDVDVLNLLHYIVDDVFEDDDHG